MTRSLPIAQFKKKNKEESSPSNNEFAVCLGEFQEGEWLKHLPNCCHVFHTACIDTWFQSHTNCPLCRSHVFNLSPCRDFSVSAHTLLDIPTREELSQEREANYQVLRSQILQNLALGPIVLRPGSVQGPGFDRVTVSLPGRRVKFFFFLIFFKNQNDVVLAKKTKKN
ncbi:hypothetical protein NC651_002399 [Populus alba x Populus x berolinensis]|nr:hypothetical protein NC651_002399 [Populus alba x Populus x berolinensis]